MTLETQPYSPDRSLIAKVSRRMTQWHHAAPVTIETDRPLLSITFDDCPANAAHLGADILDSANAKGCFYIATDLIGQTNHMGRMVERHDVQALYLAGHEIGAHTHTHLDCRQARDEDVIADIERNLSVLTDMCEGARIESFAYPFGETSYSLKTKLAKRFTNMRGVLAGTNAGKCDRAQLRAYELDQDEATHERAFEAMEELATTPGWMMLFTHDVSEAPSPYGIHPRLLVSILRRARRLGIQIVTPSRAVRELGLMA